MAHNGHSGHDPLSGPLLPASPDIGTMGRLLVLLSILTAIMQGSFVVGSSHEMHVWGNPLTDTMKAGAALDLPPYSAPSK